MTAQLTLEDFLPYLLSVTSNAVSDRIAAEYQVRFGLKIPEWRLLAVLGQGKPMTQRDLARATVMDKVTISRATSALVERQLLVRSPSEHDGRSHLLELSAAGSALYAEIVPTALAMEARLLDALNDGERALLVDMLARLRAAAA